MSKFKIGDDVLGENCEHFVIDSILESNTRFKSSSSDVYVVRDALNTQIEYELMLEDELRPWPKYLIPIHEIEALYHKERKNADDMMLAHAARIHANTVANYLNALIVKYREIEWANNLCG